MTNRIETDLLTDILRAESAGEDLEETSNGIYVCAMRKDGTKYPIGWVSESYQSPEGARQAISQIKFANRKVKE